MALNAFLKLKGKSQGDIKGSVTQKGREGKILVIAATHEVLSPRDAASGQATGKRQHKPFVITKEIDLATPRLYSMLVLNEPAAEWELQFWAPKIIGAAGTGAEVQHYTVRLFNAQLCDIRFQMPNNRNPELARYAEYEELSFSYSKIQWLWVAGGTSAEDDWLASDGSNLAAAKPGRASKAAAKRTPAAAPVASVKRKL